MFRFNGLRSSYMKPVAGGPKEAWNLSPGCTKGLQFILTPQGSNKPHSSTLAGRRRDFLGCSLLSPLQLLGPSRTLNPKQEGKEPELHISNAISRPRALKLSSVLFGDAVVPVVE